MYVMYDYGDYQYDSLIDTATDVERWINFKKILKTWENKKKF